MSSSNSRKFIQQSLLNRDSTNRRRKLTAIEPLSGSPIVNKGGKELINFCSNDYLGLSDHPEVIGRSKQYLERYGAGAGASRLVSGSLTIHEALEQKLANTFGVEAALLFNSGFQANVSIIPALVNRNSLILIDKKAHNSLLQGALLSRATVKRFRHNDINHLSEILESESSNSYNRTLVVSETVFSMDGDRSPLQKLLEVSNSYGAMLYSDDAHALGVLGENGLGLNFGRPMDINLGAFGKAFGGFGSYAGCSLQMKEFLVNYSSGFIYTTALPPAVIGALDAALELIPTMNEERVHLFDTINAFKSELHSLGFSTGASDSQIIPIIIGKEEDALALSRELEKNGLWVSAIRPPTVEDGESRIRITITAKHTDSHISQLLDGLSTWKTK